MPVKVALSAVIAKFIPGESDPCSAEGFRSCVERLASIAAVLRKCDGAQYSGYCHFRQKLIQRESVLFLPHNSTITKKPGKEKGIRRKPGGTYSALCVLRHLCLPVQVPADAYRVLQEPCLAI